jgi:hypothetical protein
MSEIKLLVHLVPSEGLLPSLNIAAFSLYSHMMEIGGSGVFFLFIKRELFTLRDGEPMILTSSVSNYHPQVPPPNNIRVRIRT